MAKADIAVDAVAVVTAARAVSAARIAARRVNLVKAAMPAEKATKTDAAAGDAAVDGADPGVKVAIKARGRKASRAAARSDPDASRFFSSGPSLREIIRLPR